MRKIIQHPNNAKSGRCAVMKIAVVCCALAVLLGVGFLLVLKPWQVSAEKELVEQGAPIAQEAPASETQQTKMEPNVRTPTSDDEEWPGQSLGMVGPNGEGAYTKDDYSTNEELLVLLANADDEKDCWEKASYKDICAQGELMITFNTGYSELECHQLVWSYGGVWGHDCFKTTFGSFDPDALCYFPDCLDLDSLKELSAQLEEHDEVKYAAINYEGRVSEEGEASETRTLAQTYLSSSKFHLAWKVQKCSKAVTVAVLDAGFDLDHPDLAGNLVAGADCTKGGAAPLFDCNAEESSHGTMVSGIISACAENGIGIDGASYNANVMPFVICDAENKIRWAYVCDALQAILNMTDKPEVVNMSFEFTLYDAQTQEAANKLHDAGVVLVAASGNWRHYNADGSVNEESPNLVKYPAAFDNVISVGSLNSEGAISDFSNRNAFVDLCAPGEGILSTSNPDDASTSGLQYSTMSGTSFSAPQVSAAAALVKARWPELDADGVLSALTGSAIDLGAAGRDDDYGCGKLDAATAVGYSSSSGYKPGSDCESVQALLDEGYAYFLSVTGGD